MTEPLQQIKKRVTKICGTMDNNRGEDHNLHVVMSLNYSLNYKRFSLVTIQKIRFDVIVWCRNSFRFQKSEDNGKNT